jgi:hypothetical protein
LGGVINQKFIIDARNDLELKITELKKEIEGNNLNNAASFLLIA